MHVNNSKDSAMVADRLEGLIAGKLSEEHGRNSTGLPQKYELLHWHKGDSIQTLGLVSAPYMDYWSQQNFAISYPDYRGFLVSRMWRQIVFALVLFLCITGAFALIYLNLVKQRRLSDMRTDFINNITHELKTPISTVRVALEAITNFNADKDPEKEKEYFNIAQSELNRLALLVERVLQMSQMNNGETVMQFERFDLKELTSQILSTMKVQFDRKHAEVELNTSGDDFEVEADRMHLTGVVYNLLDNAVKYGNGNTHIDVNIKQDNGSVMIDIADNGKGISPDYVDKVFDKFFRVPTGDTHDIKGHGLGLSYVAEIVQKHNGTISVDSKPGKGSTFSITLPRQHAN
jgi:signal transduction histidine kinase